MLYMKHITVKGFIVFSVLVSLWVLLTPLLLLLCWSVSGMIIFTFPLSLLLCSRTVYNPSIHKMSSFRVFISSIPWCQWFNASPIKGPFTKNMIIFAHPHGLLSLGTLMLIHFVPESETILAASPFLFYIPIFGWLLPWMGVVPATKRGLSLVIESDSVLLFLPGGVPEIVCAENCRQGFFIKRRMGIFKLAWQYKQTILPIVIENEEKMYKLLQLPFQSTRLWLSWVFNIPFTFPWFGGIWGTFIPHRVPLHLIVGEKVEPGAASSFFTFKSLYIRALKNISNSKIY